MTKEISINVQLNKKEPGSLFGTKKPEQKEESNKPALGGLFAPNKSDKPIDL